jgi:hypothetical protein
VTIWKSRQTRGIALVVITGLVVAWARYGLQHHWKSFASWEQFFWYWFIHTIGVGAFTIFAAAAIIATHDFFTGAKWKDDQEVMAFYVVMTVLIGAIFIAVIANRTPSDDEDDVSARQSLTAAAASIGQATSRCCEQSCGLRRA